MNYEMNTKIATVMAVHRERYELYTENETFYGRLKTVNFYNTKELVEFLLVFQPRFQAHFLPEH